MPLDYKAIVALEMMLLRSNEKPPEGHKHFPLLVHGDDLKTLTDDAVIKQLFTNQGEASATAPDSPYMHTWKGRIRNFDLYEDEGYILSRPGWVWIAMRADHKDPPMRWQEMPIPA